MSRNQVLLAQRRKVSRRRRMARRPYSVSVSVGPSIMSEKAWSLEGLFDFVNARNGWLNQMITDQDYIGYARTVGM